MRIVQCTNEFLCESDCVCILYPENINWAIWTHVQNQCIWIISCYYSAGVTDKVQISLRNPEPWEAQLEMGDHAHFCLRFHFHESIAPYFPRNQQGAAFIQEGNIIVGLLPLSPPPQSLLILLFQLAAYTQKKNLLWNYKSQTHCTYFWDWMRESQLSG